MILSGNIESKNFYLKNYQETPTKIKTYLGEAKVFRNTFTGDRVLAFYQRVLDQEILRQKVETIQHKILDQRDSSLKLLDYEVRVDAHWSKTIYHLFIFYECFEDTLSEKLKRKTKLTEEEILQIFYSVLNCLKELQSMKKFHGDLRPECLAQMKDGSYKVMIKYEENNNPEKVQKQRLNIKESLYMCPQMYQVLNDDTIRDVTYRPYESDIFSLGLIILQSTIEENIQDIYQDEEIDEEILEKFIGIFTENFNFCEILKRSLTKMLNIDYRLRPTPRGLLMALPPHSQIKEIFNKRRSRVSVQRTYPEHTQIKTYPEHTYIRTQRVEQFAQTPRIHKVSYSPVPSSRWIDNTFSHRQSRYSYNRIERHN